MSDDSYLSPKLRSTLEFIKSEQRKLDSIVAPAKQKHNEMQATLSNVKYYETMQNFNSIVAPAVEAVNKYKAIIDSVTNTIPNISVRSKNLISNVTSDISTAVSSDSFPEKITKEQNIDEYIDNRLQELVGSDVISKLHEENQEPRDYEFENSDPPNGTDQIVDSDPFLSKMKNLDYRMLLIYFLFDYILTALANYATDSISEIDLNKILEALSQILQNL